MKLWGLEINFKKNKPEEVPVQDAPAEPEEKIPGRQIVFAKIPRVRNPVLSFKARSGTGDFEQPEYDMAEIGRIEDVESYVARAFTLKEGLMFKEGWQLVGKNPQTIKYMKIRFDQIGAATNTPWQMILQGLGEDLVRFSNAFLVKVRNEKASGGRIRTDASGREIKPIAGYFPVPVSTMRFKRDETGKIKGYRQEVPGGLSKEFRPEDVVHVFFRRKKGFLVGTPSLIPVKDDIRALRRIEENIEMLVYQHLFPLFHYKVGTELNPAREYPDGTREIDVVQQQIEIMPAEGMIVTSERHEISAIGSEGRALRAEGYLTHFKQRLFSGLGVSAIDMGEGDTANRGTADSMSRNLVDDVKHFQQTLETFVNEYVIKELLLESTLEDPTDETNLVQLIFNEIDIESKIKVEAAAIQSFSGHAITHSEVRRIFGKEPLTEEEWEDTFWKRIREPELLIQAMDEPYSAEAKAIARSTMTAVQPADLEEEETAREKEQNKELAAKNRPGPSSSKGTSGQRSAAARTRPSNQHGQKSGPEKRKSSFESELSLEDGVAEKNRLTAMFDDLQDNTISLIQNSKFTMDWFRQTALGISTLMKEELTRLVRIDFRNGFRSTKADLDAQDISASFGVLENRVGRLIDRYIAVVIQGVMDTYKNEQLPAENQTNIVSLFDSLRFRSRFIYNSERHKANNYGVLFGLRKQGHEEAMVIVNTTECQECRDHEGKVKLSNLSINEIPGFHPNCTCKLRPLPNN